MLIIRKLAVGWGNEHLKVCMKCEEEREKSGKTEPVFAIPRAGWQ